MKRRKLLAAVLYCAMLLCGCAQRDGCADRPAARETTENGTFPAENGEGTAGTYGSVTLSAGVGEESEETAAGRGEEPENNAVQPADESGDGEKTDEYGIPAYYYADDYLPGKIAEIRAHDEACALHGDGFIWITDTHYSREGDPTPDNMGYSPLLIDKIVHETSVNRVVFGGDIMTDFTEDKEEAKTEFRANRFRYPAPPVEYYQIRGNHDYNGVGSTPETQRLTPAESYAVLSKDLESRAHVLDRSVYYFDNEFQRIRTFCVSCAYSDAIPKASQPLLYSAFADVPDGWSVLVLSHIGAHWDSESSSVVVMPEFENVAAALDALKARSSFTYKGVTYDYTGTDVTVIGVISGHTHNDYDILTSGGVHIISTACDKCLQGKHSAAPRKRNTVSEQCFDVVQIDTEQKMIYLTRIGAGEDRTVYYG